MPNYSFNPEDMKKGLTIAKIVKPESKDYVLKFNSSGLTIFSSDSRKYVISNIRANMTDVAQDFESDEYLLPMDRLVLLETDLEKIDVSLVEKGLQIKAGDGKQSRSALVKKRSELTKKTRIPSPPVICAPTTVKPSHFEELLRQVSCSALVKETKTDEDRKINQVHFYPALGTAYSTARFYATTVVLPGLELDLSIVSSDIPLMRTFCSKGVGDDVVIGQDKRFIYLNDPQTQSFLCVSRVAIEKPELISLDPDGYDTVIAVDRDQLAKNLKWSTTAVEGTSRMSIRSSSPIEGETQLSFFSGNQELSSMPAIFLKGNSFHGDFPVQILFNISSYLGVGRALLKYGHKDLKPIMEITDESPDSVVKSRHFVQSMKEKSI